MPKKKQINALYYYDFTINCDEFNLTENIKTWLTLIAKKWVFQAEEVGHKHYQGRFSLKKKKRIHNIENPLKGHFSISSSNSLGDDEVSKDKNYVFSYVMKEESRIEGPWSNIQEIDTYIPRQFRGINLRPWQKLLLEKAEAFNDRHINLIYDPIGNKGKSVVAHYARLHLKGLVIPCVNDQERLVATCCNICMSKRLRNPNPLFIDMPRAMGKDRLYGLYSAVEQIKSGYLFDLRNKYKDWDIDSPNIWVFSNKLPEEGILSVDRWKIWYITDDCEELLPYTNDFID